MNRYRLTDGRIINVEAKYLNDFLANNPGAVAIFRGISTWEDDQGSLIHVENANLESFINNNTTHDGNLKVKLMSGSRELQKWDNKRKLPPGIDKKNPSFLENPWDWFFIDEDETQEENTWIENLLGKNQVTDLAGDLYQAGELGIAQAQALYGAGGVKGGMGYWNKIRVDFPEHFDKLAKIEREINHSIFRNKETNERIYLDELDPNAGNFKKEPSITCDLSCGLMMGEL